MDHVESIKAFVAVCDAGGFSAGARTLGVSPPSVTRLINHLESSLGVLLLARSTRSMLLTEAGEVYLKHARGILSGLAQAAAELESYSSRPQGRLVISAPVTFGRMYVAGLLCRYMSENDGVTAELRLTDQAVNLLDDGIDVCVRVGELHDSTLRSRRLGATRHVVVASPRYLAQFGRPMRPEQLSDHHITHLSTVSALPEWRFKNEEAESRVRLSPRFVTNNTEAAIQHVIEGGGLTRILSYQIADALKHERLEIVLKEFEPPPLSITALYSPARLVSVKVQGFVELLGRAMRRDLDEVNSAPAKLIAPSTQFCTPRGNQSADAEARRAVSGLT